MNDGEPQDSPTPPDSQSDDELIGHVIDGRFRLEEIIGHGGMGRVFRAHQLSVERDVAVKVLHGSLSVESELRQRFFREAKVVSGLSHPNIVQLYDFGREDEWGLLYLVMELVQGVGLDEVVGRGRVKPRLAVEIVYQVCGALAEAHRHGIVHRDLKAENLLLVPVADGSLQVKVVDFGIALPQDGSERLTATGRIYGTPSYMAPEQARSRDVDGRTDLFSLGVILFEMLTGELPVQGDSQLQIMVEQIERGPPPVVNALDDPDAVPDAVARLTDRMLSVDPAERPADVREVRDRIDEIAGAQGWSSIRLPEASVDAQLFEPWLVERTSRVAGPEDSQANVADSTRNVPNAADQAARPVGESASAEPSNAGNGAGGGSASRADGPPGGNGTPQSGRGGGAGPPGGSAGSAAGAGGREPGETSSSKTGIAMLVVGIILFTVVALGVAAYAAWRWILPNIKSDDLSSKVSEYADAGVNRPPRPATGTGDGRASDDEGRAADSEKTGGDTGSAKPPESSEDGAKSTGSDPVCGPIRRAEAGIQGTYRPQGRGEDATLEIAARRVHVKWDDDGTEAGGTLWLARTSSERDGRLEVGCGRYVGFGPGNRCNGTIKERGPVLIVQLNGARACDERFTGTWMPK